MEWWLVEGRDGGVVGWLSVGVVGRWGGGVVKWWLVEGWGGEMVKW